MIGAYASLAAIVGASVVIGQAVLVACDRRALGWLAGPTGLAALLAAGGICVALFDDVLAVAVAALALVLGAVALLVARRPSGLAGIWSGLPAAALAVIAASIPFMVAGRVGVLGVGLVNDDMASHLLLAAWLDERFSPEPVLIDQGYPLGPHALVAGLERLIGSNEIDIFAGLTLAIPALTALAAYGVLDGVGWVARTLAAAATALPYLVVAYLAQEAFKEPIMALLLLAFALTLPMVRRARDAVPLGVLGAGTIYTYSFPGLTWLVAAAAIWALAELLATPERRGRAGRLLRSAWRPVAVAVGVAALLVIADAGRVADFADFRALDPDRANEGGLGNLRGHLSPLEALGVWPTSEFRLSAGAGSLPAAAFYAGAALGLVALAVGLPSWVRRHGAAVPAALVAAALVFVAARSLGTVYTSAKALAVAAPLIALIALGGLLTTRSALRVALAAAFLAGAAVSSLLVLRGAPVGPTDHMDELARIRPLVAGEKLLFLGRDNFVLYELRGSRPFTHVRNFYDPYFVRPNFELRAVGSKFDFDSLEYHKLTNFPYVLTTRAAYASGPPADYEVAAETPSYVLWAAPEAFGGRRPAERGAEPTGVLDCAGGPRFSPLRAAAPRTRPVRVNAAEWSTLTLESGEEATLELAIPEGRWTVSLRYDSTDAVRLRGPGLDAELPGNLDYRGVAPYWPAGEIRADGGPVAITATVDGPSAVGDLLRARSVAHLGDVGLTATGPSYVDGATPPHPAQGTSILPNRRACGREADFLDLPAGVVVD